MKKLYFILNIIMASLIVVGDALYTAFGNGNFIIKGCVSLLFVIMGVINFVYAIKVNHSNLKFPLFMVIGLFVCMVADIVLNVKGGFIYGALLFAVGHIFYFVAYCYLQKLHWKDFIPAVIIFVPAMLLIVLHPQFNFGGIVMEIVCVFYALIISCMVGKTISVCLCEKTKTSVILVIGSVLFMVSDLALLFYCFASPTLLSNLICMATYYPAQAILAFSIFNEVSVKQATKPEQVAKTEQNFKTTSNN